MSVYGVASHRFLVVEDNLGDAELVMDLLAEMYLPRERMTHVTCLAQAIGGIRSMEVDVILLDLRLPDGCGIDCIRAIRAVSGDIPIVVLTGLEDEELALACIGEGAQDYLVKGALSSHALSRAVGYAVARTRERVVRKRADALQRRLAAIVEASGDAILSCTVEGVVTSWNMGAEKMFGYTAPEALGRPVAEVIRPANSAEALRQDLRILQMRHGDGPTEPDEIVRLHRDGQQIVISAVASALKDATGRVVELSAICRDVTEARRRDQELRKKNEVLRAREVQLRALATRLIAAREDERTRISREVHDELGQRLTGLKMDLRRIEKWIARDDVVVPADVTDKLAEAEGLVDETVEAVQRIAVELRPSTLDALGLPAALRDEARRFQQRADIVVLVNVVEWPRPGPDVATALFRICQELLTNVARHARASELRIDLDCRGDAWVLSVEDNGVGIRGDEQQRVTSLGWLGIQERAQALGGHVEFERGVCAGTSVTVRIPRWREVQCGIF